MITDHSYYLSSGSEELSPLTKWRDMERDDTLAPMPLANASVLVLAGDAPLVGALVFLAVFLLVLVFLQLLR